VFQTSLYCRAQSEAIGATLVGVQRAEFSLSRLPTTVLHALNLPISGGHERSIGFGLPMGGSTDGQGNEEEEVHA